MIKLERKLEPKEPKSLRCRIGLHKVMKMQIPVICPETDTQPMFIMRHCERPRCDKVVDIFANWRHPWESKHREIWR